VDLQLFFRVISRFKVLVILGLVCATTLAFLSYVKVDFKGGTPSLSHRGQELWESNARLLVTPRGFGFGSARPGADAGEVEGRLPTLTALYASWVTSDPVRRIMAKSGIVKGAIYASPLPADANGNGTLPVVSITADAYSLIGSINLANSAASALRTYLEQQQAANKIPDAQRIELRPMNMAYAPRLLEPRSKTMPIVVFIAIMFATISIAFLLENLRPRVRPAADLAPLYRTDEQSAVRDRTQHLA
jgi:hypothetical protein